MDRFALVPMHPRQIATDYCRRGWRTVPIPFRGKRPIIDEWQNLRLDEERIPTLFPAGKSNVGVLLGAPSNRLIDVDLDHPLAVEFASQYLPSTGAIFGRSGKRRSHWLYYAECPTATRQWRLPNRKMVVELRSTGGQTVFPGSVHESGEPICWDKDGDPSVIDPAQLLACLQRIYGEVCRQLKIAPRQQTPRAEINTHAPLHVLDRARRYIAKLPVAVSGQGGHDTTYHTTCVLAQGFGLDRSDALAILSEWNELCQPPWSQRELEHKVDEVLKLPGWRGYLLEGQQRPFAGPPNSAIERANRHAVEHRRRFRRRLHR